MSLLDTLREAVSRNTESDGLFDGAPSGTTDSSDPGPKPKKAPNPFDTIPPTASGKNPFDGIGGPNPFDEITENDKPGPFAREVEGLFKPASVPSAPARDVTVTPATAPARVIDHRDPVLGALASMGAAPLENPVAGIAAPIAAVAHAVKVAGSPSANGPDELVRPGTDEPLPNGNLAPVSGKEKALAGAQLGVLGLGGVAGEEIEALLEPLLGEGAAALARGVVPGATAGAAFTPDHPVLGGALGGLAGALHSVASLESPAERMAAAGANLSDHPDRLLAERQPKAPTATASLADTPAPVDERPFTIRQNTVDQALKEAGIVKPTSPEPVASGARQANPLDELLDKESSKESPSAPMSAGATPDVQRPARPTFDDVLHQSPDDLIAAANATLIDSKNVEARLFGAEGAKRYGRLQAAANNTYDQQRADAASRQVEEMESALTPAQRDELYGIGQKGLSDDQLTGLVRDADYYRSENAAAVPISDLYSTVGRELTTGAPHKDAGSALRLRLAAEEIARRTGAPMPTVLTQAMQERVQRGYVRPQEASELLLGRLRDLKAAGLFADEPMSADGTPSVSGAPAPKAIAAPLRVPDGDQRDAAAQGFTREMPIPITKPLPPELDTPEIQAARAAAAAMPSTKNIDTPQRDAWRDAQALALDNGTVEGRRADIVMGPAGSGKTSVAVAPLVAKYGSSLLDSDIPKSNADEWHGGLGASALHAESALIREKALDHAMSRGANIVFPTIGDPELTPGLVRTLQNAGYTVHAHFVDVPPEEAARRVIAGWQAGKRHFVDPANILQRGDDPRRGFAAVANMPGVIAHDPLDNNVPRGTPARPITDWRREWGFNEPDTHAALPVSQSGPLRSGRPGRIEGRDRSGEEARGAGRAPEAGTERVSAEQHGEVANEPAHSGLESSPGSSVAESGVGFRKWFGASKVVDSDGQPLRVYHGTQGEFDNIRPSASGQFGPGIYMTESPEEASKYAFATSTVGNTPNVRPFYVRIEHPLVLTAKNTSGPPRDWFKEFGPQTAANVERLRAEGYDGVIARQPPIIGFNGSTPILGPEVTHYIAFSADQVRPALAESRPNGSDIFPARAPRGANQRTGNTGNTGNTARGIHNAPGATGPVGTAATMAMPDPSGLTQERSLFRPSEIPRAIRALVNPESLSADAKGTAGTIRHGGADGFRALAIANESLRRFGKQVGKLSRPDAIRYWDAAERGQTTGNATFDAGNKLLHQTTEQFTNELIALDRLKADAAIDHYIGRFWDVSAGTPKEILRRIMGKRPLEGSKSFLKQRSWDHLADGLKAIGEAQARIKAGSPQPGDEHLAAMRPATYNYVDSQLAKIAEMQRVITAEHMLRAELKEGRAKKILLGRDIPRDADGHEWVRIGDGTDPAFTIYGPPTLEIHEAYDAEIRQGLTDALARLTVKHTRATSLGKGMLGFATTSGDQIASKFGSHDGVIMHELGHVLDTKYGLRAKFAANPKTGPELQQLAALRHGNGPTVTQKYKAYVQQPEERAANALHALLHAPELMEQVAPTTKRILTTLLKSRPELAPILDIKPSLRLGTETGEVKTLGPTTIGHWYAPRDSAAVWNNYLSKGLRGSPLFDAYMAPAQASAQLLLGVSGFHATTIATEGIFSELAQSIDSLASGNTGAAAKDAGRASTAAVRLARLGSKVMAEYRKPGTNPQLAHVVDAMIKGGFRGTAQSEFWTGERVKKLQRAFNDTVTAQSKGRRLWGASRLPLDALWAGIETVSHPLLGKYVPLMKTGATYQLVARELAKLPPNAPLGLVQRVAGDAVKEMDLRFGQVTYENWFVHNVLKHAAQAIFLAPGWTFGTATLLGRGARDVAAIPKRAYQRGQRRFAGQPVPPGTPEPLVGKSAAYWIGAVLGTMLLNAILTYVHTGDAPEGKDFWAYRDGTTDQDGNPNRHTLPGYLMHDVYGYLHHPVDLVKNKLSPVLAFMERVVSNRDFFGNEVYDPDASLGTKTKQLATAALKEDATPLSIQNALEDRQRGEHSLADKARNAMGVNPAKREFVRTDAQNLMHEFLDRRGHAALSPGQVDQSRSRSDLFRELREGTKGPRDVIQLERAGELTQRQGQSMIRRARENGLVTLFKQLTPPEAEQVFDQGTDQERQLWWPWLLRKRGEARRQHAGRVVGDAITP